MTERSDKFREMVLYVARETEDDPRCGATKLNKILFYADFAAFKKLGRSISGERYQKLQYGPAPLAIRPAIDKMTAAGDCAVATRDYLGYTQKKLLALREPNLDLFTPQEIDLIRNVIDDLHDLNATEVSDLSHRFIGWRAAELGEVIPYETVFVGDPRPMTPEEAAWAEEVFDELFAEEPDA